MFDVGLQEFPKHRIDRNVKHIQSDDSSELL